MVLLTVSGSSSAADTGQWRPTVATSIGLFVAMFGAVLVDQLLTVLGYSTTPLQVVLIKWSVTALLIAIVLRGEGRTLESIGFRRPDRWDLASAVGLTVVGFVTLAATFALVPLLGFEEPTGSTGTTAADAVVVTLLVIPLTSGVTEEIWFRGYALERLEEWTASTWLAGSATVVAFVSIHFTTYALGGMIGILPLSVVLTLGYIWRRNVYVVIVAHALINFVGASAAVFAS